MRPGVQPRDTKAMTQNPYETPDIRTTWDAMWATRPPRFPRQTNSKARIAGVCEGIAVRYQVDVALVRAAFCVAALAFGGGAVAYLLAWGLMPAYGRANSPFEDLLSRGAPEAKKERNLGLCLLIATPIAWGTGPLLGGNVGLSSTGSSLLVLALLGGAWYGLHRRTPHAPLGLLAQPADAAPAPSPDLSDYAPAPGADYPPGRTTPPSWDPLGAAPDLWDLGDPQEPSAKARPRRRFNWLTAAAVTCGAVAVAAAAFLTLFAVQVTPANSHAVGDFTAAPTRLADLPESYATGVGDTTIDLSQVSDIDKLDEPRELRITHQIGDLHVILPADTPVTVRCSVQVGERDCAEHTDPQALLTVDIQQRVGSLLVERADPAPHATHANQGSA